MVYFHRFFSRRSVHNYDPFLMGTTCLFLAGKVEETPKKLRDVLLTAYLMHHKKELHDPQHSEELWELQDQLLLYERVLLQTLAFDLTVEHPYKCLLSYVKSIQGDRSLARSSWYFVNDSMRTTLCLQYSSHAIAAAAIYLASKVLHYKLPEAAGNKPWWEALDARLEDLEEISNQILELYGNVPVLESRSNGGPPSSRSRIIGNNPTLGSSALQRPPSRLHASSSLLSPTTICTHSDPFAPHPPSMPPPPPLPPPPPASPPPPPPPSSPPLQLLPFPPSPSESKLPSSVHVALRKTAKTSTTKTKAPGHSHSREQYSPPPTKSSSSRSESRSPTEQSHRRYDSSRHRSSHHYSPRGSARRDRRHNSYNNKDKRGHQQGHQRSSREHYRDRGRENYSSTLDKRRTNNRYHHDRDDRYHPYRK
ncbi:Cyclin-K, variant 2 [Balamuthia mandrillaris]